MYGEYIDNQLGMVAQPETAGEFEDELKKLLDAAAYLDAAHNLIEYTQFETDDIISQIVNLEEVVFSIAEHEELEFKQSFPSEYQVWHEGREEDW